MHLFLDPRKLYSSIKTILEITITVASSKTDGVDNDNQDMPAEEDRKQLINLISSTNKIDLKYLENEEINNYKGINSDEPIFSYEDQNQMYNGTNQLKASVQKPDSSIFFSKSGFN